MLRILIVTSTRLFREGVARMLEGDDRVVVVGSMPPGEPAVRCARDARADVALLDVAARDALVDARRILTALPGIKVVGVGAGESDREVLAWAEAGIAGCLSSEGSLEDLLDVLQSAVRGDVLCTPRTAGVLVRRVAGLAAPAPIVLTSRQAQIVAYIERGLSNKEIARELCIEPATVKNHVHAILEKLHVHRRADAAAWARRAGLTRAP